MDIANTRTNAGIAMAYILGGNRFSTAGSSTKGCGGGKKSDYEIA